MKKIFKDFYEIFDDDLKVDIKKISKNILKGKKIRMGKRDGNDFLE